MHYIVREATAVQTSRGIVIMPATKVPLIPVDQLPDWLVIVGVPRVLRQDDVADMHSVGVVPFDYDTVAKFEVEVREDLLRDIHGADAGATDYDATLSTPISGGMVACDSERTGESRVPSPTAVVTPSSDLDAASSDVDVDEPHSSAEDGTTGAGGSPPAIQCQQDDGMCLPGGQPLEVQGRYRCDAAGCTYGLKHKPNHADAAERFQEGGLDGITWTQPKQHVAAEMRQTSKPTKHKKPRGEKTPALAQWQETRKTNGRTRREGDSPSAAVRRIIERELTRNMKEFSRLWAQGRRGDDAAVDMVGLTLPSDVDERGPSMVKQGRVRGQASTKGRVHAVGAQSENLLIEI